MMAKAFRKSQVRNCVIFASGVSNSRETDAGEYARERDLVMESITRHSDRTFVYFSSYVAISHETPYAKHKRQIEELIRQHARHFLILRLPQVAGPTRNKTLLRFIARQIATDSRISVKRDATRRIIDIDDVVRIVETITHMRDDIRMVMNVGPKTSLHILDIIRIVEEALGRKSHVLLIEGGDRQEADLSDFIREFGENDRLHAPGYQEQTIRKYARLLA
jgi:nucleoside-diphosphate-sugar epimerase